MNVEGIPDAHDPWAFWEIVILCVVIAVGVLAWFVRRRWIQR